MAAAMIAGAIAFFQVREARQLRLEQAQPYVVAFMEPSPAASYVVDLVIKNFGLTAATDIRVSIDPPPQRAAGKPGIDDVRLPSSIPTLVPGQEWRTLWDTDIARNESDLPSRHTARVVCSDAHGRRLPPLEFILDWEPQMQRNIVTVYGLHDAARALREMRDILKASRETAGRGLRVFVRDGDARDERTGRHHERRRRPTGRWLPESLRIWPSRGRK